MSLISKPLMLRANPNAIALATLSSLLLAGCGPGPVDDDAKIVRATLAVLAADRPVTAPDLCIDNRTRGDPLAIYRTMRSVPVGNNRHWNVAGPLRPQQTVANRALFEDATGRRRLRINQPVSPVVALADADQRRLDGAARYQAITGTPHRITFGKAVAPSGIAARWWVINRVRRDCDRIFILSDVVRDRGIGFVSVSADHWGTTYAVQRVWADWRVVGQWDTWLY